MKSEQQKAAEIVDQVPDEEDGLDFRQYLALVAKRKFLIFAVMTAILGTVSVWTYTRTRIYRARATVIVNRRAPQVLGKGVGEVVDLSMGGFWRNKEYMTTQESVITSKSLALKVVRKLALVNNDDFWSPTPPKGGKADKKRTIALATEILRSIVIPRTVRDANILEIMVDHHNPKLAARMANAITQEYLEQNVEYKLSSTKRAVRWLSDQLDDLKKELSTSEMALYNFKKDNNIVDVSMEDKQSLIISRINLLARSLTEIRIRRMTLSAHRKQVNMAMHKDPLNVGVSKVMDNATIQGLKSAYIREQQAYLEFSGKYGVKHPQVRAQKTKVDSARADLQQEILNVQKAIEVEYKEVRDNESQLAVAVQRAKNEALELNKKEMAYNRFKQNHQNTTKLYGLVLERMKESDLSAQLKENNIRLLDRAETPTICIEPKVQINLLIGFFLGLVLGIGLAFVVEKMDSSIKSQEEVEAIPGLTYLGLVPRIPGSVHNTRGRRPDPQPDLDLIVHRKPRSPVAEACKAVRTNLMFASPDAHLNRILVTSAGPREGKTTTAVSLAITMAQNDNDNRVLALDTDMRRPRMHKVFGVSGKEGITSILLGKAKIEDVVKATEVPNLFVLPCGPPPPNPAEVCQSARFKKLLDDLTERYDIVVLDSPPIMVVTDAAVLGTLVDGALLVARTGQTNRAELREACRHMLDVGTKILGCVLNDMDLDRRKYGYYRYRRYGYSRYGYGNYGQYGDKNEAAS